MNGMDAEEARAPRRWERRLGRAGMPKDPRERVEFLLAVSDQTPPDPAVAALFQVIVHARTALRCRRAVRDAFADRDLPDTALLVLGEGNMAAVSLYLAVRAVQRYCELTHEPGPLGRGRLDKLVLTAELLRDCVLHWEEKGRESPPAFINVTDHDLLVVGRVRAGRGRKRQSAIDGLPWTMFESYVDRMRGWAEVKLEARLAAAADT
jgi:hypothetical protein